MTTRNTMSIEPQLLDLRSRAKIAHRKLREAMKKGTGYIKDLPPFLYIVYTFYWTALQDLMAGYEMAADREAASFRLVRLWMWIPIHDAEFETEVQDVVWEDLEE